jgi:flagellar protein FlaG
MTIDATSQYSWSMNVPAVSVSSSSHKLELADKSKSQDVDKAGGSGSTGEASSLARKLRDEEQQAKPADEEDSKTEEEVDLQKAVESLREYVQHVKRHLEFSVDSESGRDIIRVIDSETDEVIREIPPEEAIKMSQRLNEAGGSLIRTQA